MSRRLLAAVVAVVATAAGTSTVFLMLHLAHGTRSEFERRRFVTVVVAKDDIPKSKRLDPMVDLGRFKKVRVPRGVVVRDAILDVEELRGMVALTDIPKNEPISRSRLFLDDSCPICVQIDTSAPVNAMTSHLTQASGASR